MPLLPRLSQYPRRMLKHLGRTDWRLRATHRVRRIANDEIYVLQVFTVHMLLAVCPSPFARTAKLLCISLEKRSPESPKYICPACDAMPAPSRFGSISTYYKSLLSRVIVLLPNIFTRHEQGRADHWNTMSLFFGLIRNPGLCTTTRLSVVSLNGL